MVSIAICDDDADVIEHLQNYLNSKNSQTDDVKLVVKSFSSGEDFLGVAEQGARFDIVFMDIHMDKMDGVEVGRVLRNMPSGDDFIIIYISSHGSYFEELVQLGSFRFIRKPIDDKELDEVFSRALSQAVKYNSIKKKPCYFKFNIGSEQHSVEMGDIAYMQNTKRTVMLYELKKNESTIGSTYKFYSTISDVLEQLPDEEFVQCERSHIVNIAMVRRMENDFFVLIDDVNTHIPIGKTFKTKAKKAYFRYQENAR
jgi:DNA-binding LytR/AlgR family response regulator